MSDRKLVERIVDDVWAEIINSREERWTFRREHLQNAVANAIAAIPADDRVAKLVEALQSCPPTSNPTMSAQQHLDAINAWWKLTARAALAAWETGK
jgi:hypothetical protein